MDKSKEILEICDAIEKLYNMYLEMLKNNYEKLDLDKKLKYAVIYANVMFGYGREASILQQLNWNTSIEPLTRDLLESYAIAKNLILSYSDDIKFNGYLKYIFCEDMNQDKKIYVKLKNDTTIFDIAKRDTELESLLTRLQNMINTYFPEESPCIDLNNLEFSILKIIRRISRQFPSKSKEDIVGNALKENRAWKNNNIEGHPYDGSYVIYKSLCHSSHNNFGSVLERNIQNGFFILNSESLNIKGALSLDYYCMKDIYDELSGILKGKQ